MLFSEIPPADRTLSAILGYGAFVAVLLLLALIVFLIVRKIKRKQKREDADKTVSTDRSRQNCARLGGTNKAARRGAENRRPAHGNRRRQSGSAAKLSEI